MAHARQQIRARVKTLLTGLTTTSDRVSSTRVHPVSKGAEPTLAIGVLEEESEVMAMGDSREIHRDLTLRVEGYVQSADFDDICDDIAAEVEAVISADPSLGIGVRDTVLAATSVGAEGEGAADAGIIRLDYSVAYVTREDQPETLI